MEKERTAGPFSGPKAIYRKILPLLWNTAKTTNIKGGEQDKEGNKASVKKNGGGKKTIFLIRFRNCILKRAKTCFVGFNNPAGIKN